jgi:hypothetical protein
MVVGGEQGTAKSTRSALLRSVIDPGRPTLRSLPRNEHDLFIAARNRHVLAHLSHRGVELGRVHDSQQAARLVLGASKCSLSQTVKHYCKVDLAKELQASDWAAPELTESQLVYAARDVLFLWKSCQPLFKDLAPQISAYRIQAGAAIRSR